MFQEEIFKRIFKPFFFLSLGMVISFLLLFSKENIKYKLHKFLVFLSGILVIIFSEFIMSLAGVSLFYLKVSVTLTFLLFLSLFLFLFKKFQSNKNIT